MMYKLDQNILDFNIKMNQNIVDQKQSSLYLNNKMEQNSDQINQRIVDFSLE